MENPIFTRESFAEKLLSVYSQWYDITRRPPEDQPLIAYAEFHEHESGYMLVRKAEMWSADRHEYVYIYSLPHLDPETFRSLMEQTVQMGLQKVDPVSGHMCSGIVAVFLCDSADPEAEKLVKKYRFRKSFQFSLRGWAEAQAVLALTGERAVTANAAARNTAELLKSLLVPKKKKQPFSFGISL